MQNLRPVALSIAALVGSSGLVASALGDVRLPHVISSGMVLQQQCEAALFGWGTPGESIEITSSWGKGMKVTAGADGRWKVKIATPAGSGTAQTLTFKGDKSPEAITLDNVLIGEVWICSGQSNMEWAVQQAEGGEAEANAANDPLMRLFMVENVISLHERSDNGGAWAGATPQPVKGFSAVGYSFGKELRKKLNVPVGLISCDWGGTRVEAWMSEGALAKFPDQATTLENIRMMKDPNQRDMLANKAAQGWWAGLDNLGPKLGKGWSAAAFDDAAWGEMALPRTLDGTLANFDGVVYFRKKVTIAADQAGKAAKLSLGPIDDRDDAWVNGTMVGATHDDGQWANGRVYEIPAGLLKAGENVIAVRILDTAGPGGINGKPEQMTLKIGDTAPIALAGGWKFKAGAEQKSLPAIPGGMNLHPNVPTILFNGMVTTIRPFTPRGVIWYQGESNRDNPVAYRNLFGGMIQDWRMQFERPDMAFGFVQLAPFRYGGDIGQTSLVRESQLGTLALPNTGMAVTMDIGDPKDIHPRRKAEVGQRLALWALAKTYGKSGFAYSGPIYKGAKFDSGAARVTFDHVGAGLMAKGGELKEFFIAGEDKQFVRATATIDGDAIVVKSPRVPKPVAVRYGWSDDCDPNLFNKDGLPASPFRSDDWAMGSEKVDLTAVINLGTPLATPALIASEKGWVDLLPNQSFAAWKFEAGHKDHWKAVGNVIDYDGKATDLWSLKSYKDFEMMVDWRLPREPEMADRAVILPSGEYAKDENGKIKMQQVKESGDSGIYFRGSSKNQANIWCWPCGSGEVYGYRTDPLMSAEVKAGVTPKVNADKAPGEWNRFHITVKGDRLSIELNGKQVIDHAQLPGIASVGPIALQNHGDPVQFANLYIKELN